MASEYIDMLKIPQGYKLQWAIALGYTENENIPAPERKMNVFEWIK